MEGVHSTHARAIVVTLQCTDLEFNLFGACSAAPPGSPVSSVLPVVLAGRFFDAAFEALAFVLGAPPFLAVFLAVFCFLIAKLSPLRPTLASSA